MANSDSGQPEVLTFDLLDLLDFSDAGPQALLVTDSGDARLVLFAMRKGQQIPEHRSPSQLIVQVIDGCVVFTVAGQIVSLRAGKVLLVAAGLEHHLQAEEDALMLLTMTPSPAKVHQEGKRPNLPS